MLFVDKRGRVVVAVDRYQVTVASSCKTGCSSRQPAGRQ